MKHLKSFLTILILAIAVIGVAEFALAQKKQPIKVCNNCGQHYKGTHNCPKDKGKTGGNTGTTKKTCSQCKKSKLSSSFPKNSIICSDCVAKNKKEAEKREAERRKAEKAEQDRIINDYVNSMVYVAGGTFTMGATNEQGSDADSDEKPIHSVTLSSYYIGQTEVTQELWEAVMGSNPSEFKGAKRPVENVSWDDCKEFILKLNAKTGKSFRLPTEAEWEYAARGGNKSQGYKYSGSNTLSDVAWYDDNSGGTTHEVATRRANELGIYDMSGNVWEWCSDWALQQLVTEQPAGTIFGRVCSGGSWDNRAEHCRVSCRNDNTPGYRDNNLGVRLALKKVLVEVPRPKRKPKLEKAVTSYSCVDLKENELRTFQGSRMALIPFLRKLDDVINRNQGTINIWHVGGSHVQDGTFSHRVRCNLAINVNGGMGSRTIMFPYKLVGVNGPQDYSVCGTGIWSSTCNIEKRPDHEMGMSGITATTSSPDASVTFSLASSDGVDWTTRSIRVIGKASSSSVTPYIVINGTDVEYPIVNNDAGYLFELSRGCTSFTVKFRGLGGNNKFELRGVVALNQEPGVAYWESGVNCSATTSWLNCSLLEQDLKIAKPDLVILGMDIIDADTTNFNRDRFKSNYQQLIDRIKSVNPDCQFIFVTNSDNCLSGSANLNNRVAEKVFIELALDNNGSVWDIYKVMGGLGSSTKWVRSGLMQSDHVHFTSAGYRLIGDLLYNAIIGQYLKWKN